jgi:hypothetical protein
MALQTDSLVTDMSKLRYFDASHEKKRLEHGRQAVHSEFLRTGRISRRDSWHDEERRYLTYEEVAERTGKKLQAAGEKTHERINSFHRSIQFPKLVFHRTLAGSPHLGYCHVTAAKTKFAEFDDIKWAFYIANFFAEITADDAFFKDIRMDVTRMYFAVAVEKNEEEKRLVINRAMRGNGLLFRTHDPKEALKNVLLLGARHPALRAIIRAL